MSGSTPILNWPRSDGDRSRWPPREAGSESWNEQLPLDSAKAELYQNKVGQHFAAKYNFPGASKFKLPLPPGYALFNHCKPQHDGSVREDAYLYGSDVVKKFRSTTEFIPHAEWLMDTTIPLSDHSECGCRYNSANPNGNVRRQSGGGSSPSTKRSLGSPTKQQTKKPRQEEPKESSPQPSAIVPERASDLRMRRRFRKGELVFFRLTTTIQPPLGKGLAPITHWPGLIAVIKSLPEASNSQSDPNRPTGLEYHIRPLGLMSTSCDISKSLSDLLPFSMGDELFGGPKGIKAIAEDALRIMKEGVAREVEEIRRLGKQAALGPLEDGKVNIKIMETRWKKRWAERVKFTEMSTEWETVCVRLATALKTGKAITNSWTQTDKVELGAMVKVLPEEDRKAIESQKKALYQGLWLGGERLWVDDIIRLKKRRAELPSDLLPPRPESLDKAVFFQIDSIAVEIAGERKSVDSQQTVTAWRCLLYGNVFELVNPGSGGSSKPINGHANGSSTDPISIDGPATSTFSSSAPSIPDHPKQLTARPPTGFEFHQINPEAFEVTVDVVDVAGRFYPDILENSTWFRNPAKPSEMDAQKVDPGETALGLTGLRPGDTVATSSEKWKEDLYCIVSDATRLTEKEMKEYYTTLLSKEVASLPDTVPEPPTTLDEAMNVDEPPRPNGNGSGNMA